MTYSYFLSGSPPYLDTTKNELIYGFQSLLNDQFRNSPTFQIVGEEVVFGSGSFVDVEVRVTKALSTTTGERLGDDFKNILYKDLNHAVGIGWMYYFDKNFWIVTFSEIIKNFGASAMVRRCNNVLRWVDENGAIFRQPCAIEYKISRPRDSIGRDLVIPQGYIDVYTQLNERTKHICGNQRFLFGSPSNRIAYKVFGDGVRSFLNQETLDDDSGRLLLLSMGGNYVNESSDNLVLGIADYYQNQYTLSLSPTTISGSAGNIYKIVPTLTSNGTQVTKPLNFISSSSCVTTTGSGLITLVSNGSAIIRGYMVDNTSASASVNVVVSASPLGYEIRISPTPSQILEGDTEFYSCYLYDGGIIQSDPFTFSSGSIVPSNHYSLVATSVNSFSVKNIERYLTEPLTVICTSGSYIKSIKVDLLGAW